MSSFNTGWRLFSPSAATGQSPHKKTSPELTSTVQEMLKLPFIRIMGNDLLKQSHASLHQRALFYHPSCVILPR